jgi:hypothetical protein
MVWSSMPTILYLWPARLTLLSFYLSVAINWRKLKKIQLAFPTSRGLYLGYRARASVLCVAVYPK